MTRFVLTTDGANIGLPLVSFTPEDREHLAIFVQLFRVRLTNGEVKAFIMTNSPDFEAWQPTQHRVVELARLHIKELIRDGQISLKAPGSYSGQPAPDNSTPHRELSLHYYKQGYDVQERDRGQHDHIAYALMRQQGWLALTRSWSTASVPHMSTFDVAVPDTFAAFCPLGKELIAIFKVVIMGLGGTELEPSKIVVYTTLPETDKWPFPNVKALEMVQNFIMDQIHHNRVVLCCRPGSGSFCSSPQLCAEDNSGVVGTLAPDAQTHRFPGTFVDIVDCLFQHGDVGKNHIVDIVRMSMELAGNQSLQPERFVQSGGLASFLNTAARGSPSGTFSLHLSRYNSTG